MIVDDKTFWHRFEQHLLFATRRYAAIGPSSKEEQIFQDLLACQLSSMGEVTKEQKDYCQLFKDKSQYAEEYVPTRRISVDLALMPKGEKFDSQWAIGLELKIVANKYTDSQEYRNIAYFATGDFSSGCGFCPKGMFLQKNDDSNCYATFCKEGQLLQDYCRAVRILSHQHVDFFLLCGVMEYKEFDLDAEILKRRIEGLLNKFLEEYATLYRDNGKGKCMVCAKLTEQEKKMKADVKVLKLPENRSIFAYYIIVRKNT